MGDGGQIIQIPDIGQIPSYHVPDIVDVRFWLSFNNFNWL
jgi:hypothetical protein